MKQTTTIALALVFFGIAACGVASAQDRKGAFGVRLGVGADIEGGPAYGGQVNYTFNMGSGGLELGLAAYGGSFEEASNNGYNDYYEKTDVFALGAVANYLFGRKPEGRGIYFLAGGGVGSFSVEWEERSPTDTSLGPQLAEGGSMQSEEGEAVGLILNTGIGYRFNKRFEIRGEIPVFFIPGDGGERDGSVVPTLTITAGFTF
jgi:hypothetical protein